MATMVCYIIWSVILFNLDSTQLESVTILNETREKFLSYGLWLHIVALELFDIVKFAESIDVGILLNHIQLYLV